ncbi:MAG TPA: hypothetical protein PKU70_02205 [Vicinamibacteria bacterium]|nr:hypothetical protein [Vicinamibacteria bacterium]
MTVLPTLLFASLLPGLQEPVPVPPVPAKPAVPCSSPVHRHFDFWVGQWDVVDATGKFAGTNRIERVGDCFLQETWASAGGGYTGRSLNSVGPDGRWHQTWTDTSGLRLELSGGLIGGRMVMEGTTPPSDPRQKGPTLNRISWSSEGAGVVRQLWETSPDEGRTWTTSFDGRYHPASAAPIDLPGFFGRIAGAWIGSGSVMRRESHVELRVDRGVGSGIRLHWRNVMQGPRRDVFEGSAVYEPRVAGGFTASWWDSQGARHSIVATEAAEGSSLTALWGESGKTDYSLVEGGELQVVDSLKRPDGSWGEFGRTRLKRQ